MITINFGDTVQAVCTFDYSGPSQVFTFAFEIGDILIGPPLPEASWNFNTLNRWETPNIPLSTGTGKQQKITFVVNQISGLNPGDIKSMNWEIGTGSQAGGNWKLIKRLFVDGAVQIASAQALFSNLSVAYAKV